MKREQKNPFLIIFEIWIFYCVIGFNFDYDNIHWCEELFDLMPRRRKKQKNRGKIKKQSWKKTKKGVEDEEIRRTWKKKTNKGKKKNKTKN